MSVAWHKLDVIFHLQGGQSVKVPAYSLTMKQTGGDVLVGYSITHSFRMSRRVFYGRLDSIDMIEVRTRGWWRWAW